VEASTPCLTIPFGTFPSARLLPEFEATTNPLRIVSLAAMATFAVLLHTVLENNEPIDDVVAEEAVAPQRTSFIFL
jgi:hypothetical protein